MESTQSMSFCGDILRNLLRASDREEAATVYEALGKLCGFVQADRASLLRLDGVKNPELLIVDHELLGNHMVREFLIEQCGITEAEGAAELDVILANWPAKPDENDWRKFWDNVYAKMGIKIVQTSREINL